MLKHFMVTALLWLTNAAFHPLVAQENDNTLGALWPKVEANYPGIRSQRSAIDAARLNEKHQATNMLPQVKAQAQNTYGTYKGNAGAFFPMAGFFNVTGNADIDGPSLTANTFTSVIVEWDVYAFGKLRKENEAAHAETSKKISEYDAYLLNLKKILAERYIKLLYANAKLHWIQRNADRLDDIRIITTALAEAGLKPAADSLLAASAYIQAIGEYDKWKGVHEANLIKLSELTNGEAIEYTSSVNRFMAAKEQTLKGEQQVLSTSHPVLVALDRQADFYRLSSEVEKRKALPSLRVLGGYAYRGTGVGSNGFASGKWQEGFANSTNNYLAGIGITWNITGLHANRLKGAGLLKEAESTEHKREQYQQAMQADLSSLHVKAVQQYQQVKKAGMGVRQAMAAYDMYIARYKSGLISLTELLQIQLLLEQAENSQIEATLEYWMLQTGRAALTSDFEFLFNNL
jgi:outer membrane protein TolC